MSAAASTPEAGNDAAEDLLVPKKLARKMMKKLLPPDTNTTTEAATFMQEAVSEFLLFVCSEYAAGFSPIMSKINYPTGYLPGLTIAWSNHSLYCRASDQAMAAGKKTIDGDDIIKAMDSLGFDNYISPLKIYLSKLRSVCIRWVWFARNADSSLSTSCQSMGAISSQLYRRQWPTN